MAIPARRFGTAVFSNVGVSMFLEVSMIASTVKNAYFQTMTFFLFRPFSGISRCCSYGPLESVSFF